MKVGLRREDALCRSKWSVGVYQFAARLRLIWPPSLVGDFKHRCLSVFQRVEISGAVKTSI